MCCSINFLSTLNIKSTWDIDVCKTYAKYISQGFYLVTQYCIKIQQNCLKRLLISLYILLWLKSLYDDKLKFKLSSCRINKTILLRNNYQKISNYISCLGKETLNLCKLARKQKEILYQGNECQNIFTCSTYMRQSYGNIVVSFAMQVDI